MNWLGIEMTMITTTNTTVSPPATVTPRPCAVFEVVDIVYEVGVHRCGDGNLIDCNRVAGCLYGIWSRHEFTVDKQRAICRDIGEINFWRRKCDVRSYFVGKSGACREPNQIDHGDGHEHVA